MPYKNDNLEELFQNAANDYPLRTDNSNWDSVSAKLQPSVTNVATGKNTGLLKYAALLFFLLGGSLLYFKFKPADISSDRKKENTTAVNSQKQTLIQLGKSDDQTVKGKSDFTLKNLNSTSEKYGISISRNNFSISKNSNHPADALSNNLDKNYPSIQKNSNRDNSIENLNQQIANNFTGNNKTENVAPNQNINQSAADSKSSKKSNNVVKFNPTISRLYGTLYASPVFSMVKFQKISKPGYKIGIAIGYRINNRFSIELGLQREHINYYTDGKYFDKSGLRLKDAVSLENVTARSKLTSVPVTLKYNFASKKNSHFFAATGINVVVLTHTENYEYLVSKNGNENDLDPELWFSNKSKIFYFYQCKCRV